MRHFGKYRVHGTPILASAANAISATDVLKRLCHDDQGGQIMNKRRFLKDSLAGAAIALASLAFAALPLTDAIADELEVVGAEGVEDVEFREFYVTMDTNGETVTIAFAGPFRVFARCLLEGPNRKVLIGVTSSVTGWSVTRFPTALSGPGQEVDVLNTSTVDTGFRYDRSSLTGQFSAIGPDAAGHLFYVAIDSSTVGLGVNILGHKCIAVGMVTLMELAD